VSETFTPNVSVKIGFTRVSDASVQTVAQYDAEISKKSAPTVSTNREEVLCVKRVVPHRILKVHNANIALIKQVPIQITPPMHKPRATPRSPSLEIAVFTVCEEENPLADASVKTWVVYLNVR
jgi:hypothetical protein